MFHAFPAEHFSLLSSGVTDAVRDKRMERLDLWLQELVSEPMIMTRNEAFRRILEFCEVPENIAAAAVVEAIDTAADIPPPPPKPTKVKARDEPVLVPPPPTLRVRSATVDHPMAQNVKGVRRGGDGPQPTVPPGPLLERVPVELGPGKEGRGGGLVHSSARAGPRGDVRNPFEDDDEGPEEELGRGLVGDRLGSGGGANNAKRSDNPFDDDDEGELCGVAMAEHRGARNSSHTTQSTVGGEREGSRGGGRAGSSALLTKSQSSRDSRPVGAHKSGSPATLRVPPSAGGPDSEGRRTSSPFMMNKRSVSLKDDHNGTSSEAPQRRVFAGGAPITAAGSVEPKNPLTKVQSLSSMGARAGSPTVPSVPTKAMPTVMPRGAVAQGVTVVRLEARVGECCEWELLPVIIRKYVFLEFLEIFSLDSIILPVLVYAASWMPNVPDPVTGARNTAYITQVTEVRSRSEWTLMKSIGHYQTFHSALGRYLKKAFPDGVKFPFPSDRLTLITSGMSDSVRDKRREGLDKWMRGILTEPKLLQQEAAMKIILDFLDVAAHVPGFGK